MLFVLPLVPFGVNLPTLGPHPESLSQAWERDFKPLTPLLLELGEGAGG